MTPVIFFFLPPSSGWQNYHHPLSFLLLYQLDTSVWQLLLIRVWRLKVNLIPLHPLLLPYRRYFSYSWQGFSSAPDPSVIIPPPPHAPTPSHLWNYGSSPLTSAARNPCWLWGLQQAGCGNQGWDRLWPYNLVLLYLTALLIYSHYAGPAWNSTRYCCFFKPLSVCSEINSYFQGSLLTTGFLQAVS